MLLYIKVISWPKYFLGFFIKSLKITYKFIEMICKLTTEIKVHIGSKHNRAGISKKKSVALVIVNLVEFTIT